MNQKRLRFRQHRTRKSNCAAVWKRRVLEWKHEARLPATAGERKVTAVMTGLYQWRCKKWVGALINYRWNVDSGASDGQPWNEVRNLAHTMQGGYDFIMVVLMVRISAVCLHFLCLKGSLTVDFCPPHIKDAFYLLG